MAYRRKYSRKNYRRRRGPRYTVEGSVSHLAKQAYKGMKWLKSVVNVENKYVDNSVLFTTFNTTGTIGSLFSNMTQGVGVGQRTGDIVKLTSLTVNVSTYCDAAAAVPATAVRFLLVRGKNENGTAPSVANILNVTGSSQIINTCRNVDRDSAYEVLMDKKWVMSASGSQGTVKSFHINLQSHLQFQNASVTPESGGIWYIICSDKSVNPPSYSLYSRLRYVDN